MTLFNSVAIVESGILWIVVWIEDGMVSKLFWILLVGFFVSHAWSFWVDCSTGTMKHASSYSVIEQRLCDWIRKLSPYDGINIIGIMNFVSRIKECKKVHMRMASFLKFNSMNVGKYFSKNTTSDVLEQGILLLLKDMCDNVWPVISSLLLSMCIRIRV